MRVEVAAVDHEPRRALGAAALFAKSELVELVVVLHGDLERFAFERVEVAGAFFSTGGFFFSSVLLWDRRQGLRHGRDERPRDHPRLRVAESCVGEGAELGERLFVCGKDGFGHRRRERALQSENVESVLRDERQDQIRVELPVADDVADGALWAAALVAVDQKKVALVVERNGDLKRVALERLHVVDAEHLFAREGVFFGRRDDLCGRDRLSKHELVAFVEQGRARQARDEFGLRDVERLVEERHEEPLCFGYNIIFLNCPN